MKVTGKSKNVRVPDWQYPPSVGAHRPQGLVGPMPLPEVMDVFNAPSEPNKPRMRKQADDYSYINADMSSPMDFIRMDKPKAHPELVMKEQAERTRLLRQYMQARKARERHLAIIDMWLEKNGYLLRSKDLYGGVK